MKWEYNSFDGDFVRATLFFADKTQSLISKSIATTESDPEGTLDSILKGKFSSYHFVEVALPRCGRDYVPDESILLDAVHGVRIKYRRLSRQVELVTWTDPFDLDIKLREIRSCH